MAMMMRLVVLYMVLVVALMCCSLILVLIHLKPEDHHVSSSDCRIGYGCIPSTITETSSSSMTDIRSRKLLLHNNAEEVFKSFVPVLMDHHHHHQQQQGGKVNVYWSSLRDVPSGPDPLHHRGSGPKKHKDP